MEGNAPITYTGLGIMPVSTSQTEKAQNSWDIKYLGGLGSRVGNNYNYTTCCFVSD